MRNRVFFLLMILMTVFLTFGQEYSVVSFEPALKDLTARAANTSRVDGNGRKCAVIKVYVEDSIATVRGNAIGDVPAVGMEKWIYLSHDSKDMEIVFDRHYPLHITFMDYDIPMVTGQMTYILKLKENESDNPSETNFNQDTGIHHNKQLKQEHTELSYYEIGDESHSISQTTQHDKIDSSVVNNTFPINELANIEQILGCRFKSLDPEDMKIPNGDEGLQIVEITPGPFKEANIKNNFIIRKLENQDISSIDDFIRIWTSIQEKSKNAKKVLIISGYYPNGRKGYYAVSIP